MGKKLFIQSTTSVWGPDNFGNPLEKTVIVSTTVHSLQSQL